MILYKEALHLFDMLQKTFSVTITRRLDQLPIRIDIIVLQLAIHRIDIMRLAHRISPLLAVKHEPDHRNESQHTTTDGKEQEHELIPDILGQPQRIERKRHAELLTEEVDDLRDLAALGAVAVDAVGIAGRGDDLDAEGRDAHAEQGRDPDGVVLQREAVDK